MKEKIKKFLNNKFVRYLIIASFLIIVILAVYIYKQSREVIQVSENNYNRSFYELIDYVQNVENYLAKSLISTTPQQGSETLTNVWREANLAEIYLSQLPIQNQELQNTEKFLNQVSDYSYVLSRKTFNNESLTEDDFNNLDDLYNYSVELKNTLLQLENDMQGGQVSWKELTKKTNNIFAQEVSNISKDSFSNLEENFHEYTGLIYDGAFSENISKEKKGLTGVDIDEEKAKNNAEEFIGKNNIKEINSNGFSENGDIQTYDFIVKNNNEETINISISKKGGHVVYMNSDRNIQEEKISQDEANEKAKDFLNQKEYKNLKETYYMKNEKIVTINYAYQQNEIIMYPDLIKVKVALDNGEILGLEAKGYLNSHYERQVPEIKISKEEARKNINKKLEITSENLVYIPTEYNTEVLCWEFKGKVKDIDYLVYINAETGKEEDILLIVNTPNGTLTQ